MLALIGGNLIDGTGSPGAYDTSILIDEERIKAIGPRESLSIPDGVTTIDVTGLTVMPGLIDCHDHLASKGYDLASRWGLNEPISLQHIRTAHVLTETLISGYTCIRDAGGLDAGYKLAVEEGLHPGPRLVISVNIISPTGGICDRVSGSGHQHMHDDPRLPSGVADGVDNIRSKVREMVRVGADVIKFASTGGASSRPGHGPKDIEYTYEEIEALIQESQSLGRKTMCHALGGPGLRNAILAGADSIEHGCYLAEEPDLINIMADKGIFLVPTFEVYEYHSTVSAPHMQERAKHLKTLHQESMQKALQAGVKVVAGTDAGGFIHGNNAHELELLVQHGMTTMQAIQAATGWAAECVGLDKDIGTISTGKFADLVVLEGNPLDDIRIIQDPEKIKMVMKGGKLFVDRCKN
jgi:imidazolonepropionase-like amidohydrolase